MVVICPKCKVKLKVADEKIAPQGTRFKCPKCSTVLLVKRPVPKVKPLDENTVLVSHENPSVLEKVRKVLVAGGYRVVTVSDGIAAMVSATRELPFLAVLGVSIPKIYGFEVCRRLKSRPETKDMKVILIASIYDQNKYRRQPESFHGADGYIEEQEIETALIKRIDSLRGIQEEPGAVPPADSEKPSPVAEKTREMPEAAEKPQGLPETPEKPAPAVPRPQPFSGDVVEKAKRLARTILSDIYLYSKAKVDDSIRNNTFHHTFSSELREGLKLYEARISAEVRSTGDFFNEAVNDFIEKRKKEIAQ